MSCNMDALSNDSFPCTVCSQNVSDLSQRHSCFEKEQFNVESQLRSLPFQVSFQHGDFVCKDCYHKLLKRSWIVEELNKIDTELREKYDARVETIREDLKRPAESGFPNSDISVDAKRVRLQSAAITNSKEEDGGKLFVQEELKTEVSISDCLQESNFVPVSQHPVSLYPQSAVGQIPVLSQVRSLSTAPGVQPQVLGVSRAPGISQVLGISQSSGTNMFTQSFTQAPGSSQAPGHQVMSQTNTVPTQHYASPGSLSGHGTLTQVVYSSPVPGQLTAQVVPVPSAVPGGATQYQYVVVQPQHPHSIIQGQQSQVQPMATQQAISTQAIPAQQQAAQQQAIQQQATQQQAAQQQAAQQQAAQAQTTQSQESSSSSQNNDEEQETVVKVMLSLKSSLVRLDQKVNFLNDRLFQLEAKKPTTLPSPTATPLPTPIEASPQVVETPPRQASKTSSIPQVLETMPRQFPQTPSPQTNNIPEEKYSSVIIQGDSLDNLESILCSYPASKQSEIKTMIHAAVDREKLALRLCSAIFSKEEMQVSNCHGANGKFRLDPGKLEMIRRLLFIKFPCDDEEKVWKRVKSKVDTKCRGARFYRLHHGERKLGEGSALNTDPDTVTILM